MGEGDFSFSGSLARAFGSASNITATSLDSVGMNSDTNCCAHRYMGLGSGYRLGHRSAHVVTIMFPT